MGALYDKVKAERTTTPTVPTPKIGMGVLSPIQNLTQYRGIEPKPIPSSKLTPKPQGGGGLYERIKAERREREVMRERGETADVLFPKPTPNLGRTQQSTAQVFDGMTTSDFAREVGQGIARAWSATGARLAQNLGTAKSDVVDPKTFLGSEKVGQAVFGRSEPFTAESEDIEFLEAFGTDPKIAAETGGSLTMLLSALDLTGAGGAPKGLSGAIRAIRAAKTAEEALKVAKGLGLAEDVAQEYAELFMRANTASEAKQALEAATAASKPTNKIPTLRQAEESLSRSGGAVGVDTAELPARNAYASRELADTLNLNREFLYKRATEQDVDLLPVLREVDQAPDITARLEVGSKLMRDLTETTAPKVLPTPEGLPDLSKGTRVRPEAEIPTNAQIDALAERVRQLEGKTPDSIRGQADQLYTEASVIEDTISSLPGKQLIKYVSPTTGNLPEITGKPTMKSLTGSGREVPNSRFGQYGDSILRDIYDGDVPPMSKVEADLADYRNSRNRLNDIKDELSSYRKDIATMRKAKRVSRIGTQYRKAQFRALQNRYNLTDRELAKIRRGRDISAMEEDDFRAFMKEAERKGAEIEEQSAAMMQLKGTIKEKDLKKWENLVAAMNLPPIHKMNTPQLKNLERILDAYETGDEFLPVRMLQTIDNTKLKDAKTVREVLEVLAKDTGITLEEATKIKPTEFHRYMGDVSLARQHPFFERLVEIKNTAFLKANARVYELSNEMDGLVETARKSQKRSLAQRAIPTDDKIVQWLEADADTRAVMARTMTAEELKAGKRMDEIFREYYDYLVKKNAEQKFSRFEDQYFPHVRRGFLEAWKDDGVLTAFKEMRDQFAQDQKYMNILNEQTKEVLPYEKWIGFQQFRSDTLVPTKNAARAFEAYITALEKARHLDEMTPEIMAYVHALSPRELSKHGLELDTSLKRFVKEWVNANKGRHPKGFFEPGGKLDWTLRTSTAFTRAIDLGFNFTTQLVAPIGENMMTLTMLKPKTYARAVARHNSKQGKKIIEQNRGFVGRTLFDELSRATSDIGDKFLGSMFAIFHTASRTSNELFLLGKLTKEEFETGVITAERLAKIQLQMGKYRHVPEMASIVGRTSEAKSFLQYKNWAVPIFRATATNSRDLAKIIRTKGIREALASEAGKELFYSIGLGAGLAGLFYSQYRALGDKKERSFLEDLAYKAMRDSVSILGALDPTLWSSVRVADFYDDLATAILDLVTLDTYKSTGELKAPKEFGRLITPAPIRQLQRELQSDSGSTKSGSGKLPTPAGLPSLPKAGGGLPTPPGLPALP